MNCYTLKQKFSEYYKLSEEEVLEHWKNDVFSLDANVLLNLYRYTPKTREAFFDLLEQIKDRLWIPYQAGYEYQKNRLIVIRAQKEAYTHIRETLVKQKKHLVMPRAGDDEIGCFLHRPAQLFTQSPNLASECIKSLCVRRRT